MHRKIHDWQSFKASWEAKGYDCVLARSGEGEPIAILAEKDGPIIGGFYGVDYSKETIRAANRKFMELTSDG